LKTRPNAGGLELQLHLDKLSLSWPVSEPAAALETTDTLSPASWVMAEGTPVLRTDKYEIEQVTTNRQKYFRLRFPPSP